MRCGRWDLPGRERQANPVGGAIHPIEVSAQLEGPAAVGARDFVDRIAVEKTAVEDGDRGLLGGNQLSFDVHEYRHPRLRIEARGAAQEGDRAARCAC